MPAGNAVTKSVSRTPSGESSRQSPGKSPTAAMLPTQRPFIQKTPVETFTFCSTDQPEMSFFACECAFDHAGAKSGIRSEPGGGGDFGDVDGNVPGMGDAEGTGNDEKGYEEIGRVLSAVQKFVSTQFRRDGRGRTCKEAGEVEDEMQLPYAKAELLQN